MKILKFIGNALLTVLIACLASWAFYNFAPINLFHVSAVPKAGSTFATLIGSNVISAFPATYNANLGITANTSAANTFSGLQTLSNGFISQSSSTVVGNFTASGSLTLGNELTVPNGGTSSTTLSQYAVMIGNATGDLLTPTNGLGSSGQFLTSQGNGSAPQWTTSSLNQAANYTWTGLHTFNTGGIIDNASSTFTALLNVNGGIELNGVSYTFPSTQGAPGAVFVNNGSGTLTSELVPNTQYATTSLSTLTGTATSSVFSIPAGILTASSTITAQGQFQCSTNGGCSMNFADSAGDIFAHYSMNPSNTGGTWDFPFFITITSNGLNSQYTLLSGMSFQSISYGDNSVMVGKQTSVNMSGVTGFEFAVTTSGGTIGDYNIVVRP